MKSRSPVGIGLGVFARGIQPGIGILSLVCEFVVASLLNGPLADLERELGGACRGLSVRVDIGITSIGTYRVTRKIIGVLN